MDRFRSLQAFREVAKYHGFAAAARAMNTSPPSVSRMIAELEDDLGVRLFSRSTRSVTLTEEGEHFLHRGIALLDEFDAVTEEMRERQSVPRGLLRVSSVVAFGQERIARLIPAFMQEYPAVQVELELANRKVDLIQERFDIAIRVGSTGALEASAHKARKIYAQKLFFVATPEYAARFGVPGVPAELENHRIVKHISGNWGRVNQMQHAGRDVEIRLPDDFVVNSPNAALNAVLSGGAIGLLGDFMVADMVARGQLVRILPQLETLEQPVYAVFVHKTYMPAKIRAFIDFFTQND